MQTDTQVPMLGARSSLLYRSGARPAVYNTNPVPPVASETSTLNSSSERHATEPVPVRLDAVDVPVTSTQVAEAVEPGVALQQKIDGTVVGIDENTVRCELAVGGQQMHVQLPLSLFPEDVEFGMPISIAMVTANGYRMPKVSIRAIDRESMRESDEELDRLLEAF